MIYPVPKPVRAPREPKPLTRKVRVKPRNKPRAHARFKRAYLDPAYVALVQWKGCVVPGCYTVPVQACHRKSRGAGGTWMDLFGLCVQHHDIQHRIGNAEFERRFHVDLEAEAAKNVMEFRAFTKDG